MFQFQGETFDKRLAFVSDLISQKQNIVILAGAGISVSCGIPDFRSKDGLYNNLNYHELGLTCAEDLFDINAFSEDPRPFWTFVRRNNFASDKIVPSASHLFLAWLDRQQVLLRIYTQNIDGLESQAGVDEEKIVYAHGSFTGATCMKCKAKYQSSEIASDVKAGVPVCHRRIAKKGKVSRNATKTNSIEIPPERRSSRNSTQSTLSNNMAEKFYPPPVEKGCCGGIIKPNITFFGEKLDNNISRRLEEDYKKADALIVMGTSLSVAPMSKLVGFLPDNIPRILINRDIVQVRKQDEICLFDACLLGNCDAVTQAIKDKISNTDTKSKDKNHQSGRLVTDDNNGTWLKNQPRESVLLFEGALLSAPTTKEEAALPPQNVVVHCDHCENEIKGNIFCCKSCFDFDLCGDCYPEVKLTHAAGEHEFEIERTS